MSKANASIKIDMAAVKRAIKLLNNASITAAEACKNLSVAAKRINERQPSVKDWINKFHRK